MINFLGAWWDLLLGQSEECDAPLEAKLRTNKTDVIVECEAFVAVLYGILLPCFRTREGVTKFLVLDLEGVSEEDSEWNVAK